MEILNSPREVGKWYSTSTTSKYASSSPDIIQRDSILRALEIKWDVLLPPKYRHALVINTPMYFGRELFGYRMYRIKELAQMNKIWYASNPKLVKSLVIGGDGAGTDLMLILEPHSTYRLSPVIYTSDPDTGRFGPTINLEERF